MIMFSFMSDSRFANRRGRGDERVFEFLSVMDQLDELDDRNASVNGDARSGKPSTSAPPEPGPLLTSREERVP